MSAAAVTERDRWAAYDSRFGTCGACHRAHDENGQPLRVARVPGGRVWRCFDCSTRPTTRRRTTMTTATKPRAAKPPAAAAPPAQRFEMIPLAKLKPAGDNPRGDVGDITELAASMQELGVLEPFVTVQQNGHYLIVAGHRRYAAAAAAGLLEVPAVIRELTEEQRIQAMLIENLQREDLTAIEEARAYSRLVEEFGATQRGLAAKVSRSQSHVSKRMALLGLPKEALADLDSGGITMEEAQELARIKDPKRALHAWKMRGQAYGGIKRAVQDELDGIKRTELVEAEARRLESTGVRAIAIPWAGHSWDWPKSVVEIEKNPSDYSDALDLDPISHASEPCHAIAVRTDYTGARLQTAPVCIDRGRHPKAKTGRERGHNRAGRTESDQHREHRELQKRRDTRRAIAGQIATGPGVHAPLHGELVLRTLIESAHAEVLKVACRLLDLDVAGSIRDFGAGLTEHAAKSPQNRRRVELAIAFGTYEEALGLWYDWSSSNTYFELLELNGYEVSDVERKKLKRPASKKKATA